LALRVEPRRSQGASCGGEKPASCEHQSSGFIAAGPSAPAVFGQQGYDTSRQIHLGRLSRLLAAGLPRLAMFAKVFAKGRPDLCWQEGLPAIQHNL
jgi:hypothetical protein